MAETKDPLFRYLALLQLIPLWPGRISTPTLLEKLRDKGFEIDKRSLQRDLRDKLARRFPIIPYTDERPYRWGYRENAWFDPRRLPNQDTSAALAMHLAASHLTHLLPQGVLDQLTPQFRAASDYLDGMEHNGLAHWARRVRSLPNGKALLPAELSPQIWTLVSTALVENRQLRVEYRSRSQGTTKSYRIHPAGLVSRHSISYLIGSANDYDDLRQFALHRIQRAELLDEPAREPDGFDIDRYIEGGAFAWRQAPHEVELIADVHPQIAWLLNETPLSPRQSLQPLPDTDWQRLRASVPLDQETLWWIFGLNDNIRVHAPPEWVEEIDSRLENLRTMYAEPSHCDTSRRAPMENSPQAPATERKGAKAQTAEEMP
ncbi:Predicted DNA-binding transcriptional regulator YafY, contains an HTH and WYL domains [Azotobacter beijerinckii]|uniref:Predicted DNA-binding transcriptional regulator YafY, contains an HTH and WYL domains n=1 Tax=Azotobacter beijerinckii TaxID=170623 RepID=A0A1H6TTK8_9GAMM|nr:WYL domain-containing protein [Azotobacter beijerinckii]SEI79052.1 Predicted DNA-binding transcriptional regulator YafY, contains an HTH and WYL domains [Azotobacter beijerinckii]